MEDSDLKNMCLICGVNLQIEACKCSSKIERERFRFQTVSWDDIENRLSGKEPMLMLVRVIRKLGYAAYLHPITSVWTLRIGKVPNYYPKNSEIEIEWLGSKKVFRLRYFQDEFAEPWEILFDLPSAEERLQRVFVKRLRWFKGEQI